MKVECRYRMIWQIKYTTTQTVRIDLFSGNGNGQNCAATAKQTEIKATIMRKSVDR
jgi:hypothetical protein